MLSPVIVSSFIVFGLYNVHALVIALCYIRALYTVHTHSVFWLCNGFSFVYSGVRGGCCEWFYCLRSLNIGRELDYFANKPSRMCNCLSFGYGIVYLQCH